MSNFDLYAAYYDLFYRDKDYAGEVTYLHGLASEAGRELGPAILDLGCGTGRHALLLAANARRVVGVDVSESMVEQALDRATRSAPDIASRIAFSIGDVRSFETSERFDCVVSLFHVLSYQVTNKDQDAFFDTARRHLSRGGLLIFDFWYGPAVLIDQPKKVARSVEGSGVRATRKTTPLLKINENRVDVRFDIEVEHLDSGRVEQFTEHHYMRYMFLPEIEQRLHMHGFELVVCRKWMSSDELGEADWNGCVAAVVR